MINQIKNYFISEKLWFTLTSRSVEAKAADGVWLTSLPNPTQTSRVPIQWHQHGLRCIPWGSLAGRKSPWGKGDIYPFPLG